MVESRFRQLLCHSSLLLKKKWLFGIFDDFITKQLPHNVTWGLSLLYALEHKGDRALISTQGNVLFFPPFWMGNTRWCKLLRPVWKLAFYICLYCNLYLICIWLLKNHSPLIAGELAHALRFLASVVSQSFLAFGDILELHRKFLELSGGVNRMFELEEFLDAAQNGGSSLHCLLFYCWSPFCCLILFLQVCKTLKLFFPISLLYVNLVWNM